MAQFAIAIRADRVPCMCIFYDVFAGKVGAIVAGVVLDQISDQNKFIVSAITGLIGFVITIIFVPGALLQEYSLHVSSVTQWSLAEVKLRVSLAAVFDEEQG